MRTANAPWVHLASRCPARFVVATVRVCGGPRCPVRGGCLASLSTVHRQGERLMYRRKRPHRGSPSWFLLAATIVASACNAQSGAIASPTTAAAAAEASIQPVVLMMANSYGDLGDLPAVGHFVDRVHELSG